MSLLGAARACRERDFLMILMAFWHGLRATEVLSLTADSIVDGEIIVQRLKRSLKTTQPLMEHDNPLLDERKAVLDYLRNRPENQRLFNLTRQRFWQIVKQHGATAGLPARLCHPHAMKHTIAMQIIHSAGIENTRQWLGHKKISSTGAYLKVTDEAAAKAVGAAMRV